MASSVIQMGKVSNTNILKRNYPKQQFLKINSPDGKFSVRADPTNRRIPHFGKHSPPQNMEKLAHIEPGSSYLPEKGRVVFSTRLPMSSMQTNKRVLCPPQGKENVGPSVRSQGPVPTEGKQG